MKKIAITGNIGSGKSWVSQLFENIGIPVFYSDYEAKRLYYRIDIRTSMTLRFGEAVYLPDGQLNKPYLSSLFFSDDAAMRASMPPLECAIRLTFSAPVSSRISSILAQSICAFDSTLPQLSCSP